MQEIEADRLLDSNDVTSDAIKLAEQNGIVFIDEIDKICRSTFDAIPITVTIPTPSPFLYSDAADQKSSADASSEGVQRDLLPLIEG